MIETRTKAQRKIVGWGSLCGGLAILDLTVYLICGPQTLLGLFAAVAGFVGIVFLAVVSFVIAMEKIQQWIEKGEDQ